MARAEAEAAYFRAQALGHPDILRAKTAFWGGLERRLVKSTGFVVDTLEASLFSFAGSSSFEDALVAAANLGGDADTISAITGALAGAKYGASSIPQRWLEPLAWREELEAIAVNLLRTGSEIHHGKP